MHVFTVGYEGCDIDHFTRSLKKQGIELVADLRKNPLSRKKGFSKNRLAAALQERRIDYLHLPDLGVPAEWRKKAKAGEITRARMFHDYARKILPRGQASLERLQELLQTKEVALLCYEADAEDCHRSFVARDLKARAQRGFKIHHLLIPPPARRRIF
ncbi:MAG: DUF488 domain-containing protein [Bdellovibrionaceae bacterium]|nr:DUF488 domain-containing protein [Pseudobdellovibrionaceae bacterium]MBX3035222.1 DUF488 domain-containing protein [Pseudobdellovibrionaceae bacterium]